MAKPVISTKRLAIDKANTQMVIVVAVTSFVSVFCLVATHAVLGQNSYQSRVIAASQKAHGQLLTNINSVATLEGAYNKFNSGSTNVIGGSSTGTGENDGTNTKLILDALPDSYDFPALTSSIENILNAGHFTVSSITGTDEQLTEQSNTSSEDPQPVSMPFTFTVTNASYTSIESLITTLQQSIRPIAIDSITLSGGVSDMTLTVAAHTYYQPGVNLSITKETIQ